MHILLIHQAFAAINEPGGTRHHEFARILAGKGHQVSIISSPVSYLTGRDEEKLKYETDMDGLIQIHRTYTYPALHKNFFHRLISFFSFMLSSFFKALSIKHVDLVWGTSPPIFQGFTAWLVSRVKGVPYLLEIRDLWPAFAVAVGVLKNKTLINMSLWLENFLYKRADKLIVNSPGFVDHVTKKGGEDITVIPNGADLALFENEPQGEDIRPQLGWEGKFIVLYAGAHGMSNDLEVVLNAADLLRNTPEIQFILIGDGKEKSNLMARASEHHLDNVNFLKSVPKTEMKTYLSAADVCLAILKPIELYKTTYPNKIFDYMAVGKPVILAIDGVIRAVVEAAECGIFCPPGDPQALKTAVLSMKNNKMNLPELGNNGKEYLKKHFNRKEIGNAFSDMIEKMVEKNA